jgi:hypothetical protein
MIFPVGLKVLSQMLDPASEKCDLHIRAAGIFLMQLELLKVHRLVILCHNEGANVDEHRVLATIHRNLARLGLVSFIGHISFAFSIVPEIQSRPRTRYTGAAKDHNQQRRKNLFGRIHAQLPARRKNGFA